MTRSEQQYDAEAEAIALAIWEISTGNGLRLDSDEWDSHMQNCHAAVANSYVDGISITEWRAAALEQIGG